ncbi:MAG: hypothetical protein ACHREM_02770 [Polyangiales bacterium]
MRRAVAALTLIALVACRRGDASSSLSSAPSSSSSSSLSASSSSSPSSSPSSSVVSAEDERSRRWREAKSADPLELARLADAEGVDGLLDAIDESTDSGPAASEDDRLTALRAIAFVDDPTPALDALTKLALGKAIERSTIALQTLAAVASKRAQREEDDVEAWRRCADALIASNASFANGARRELLLRTLLGLADRGAIDRAKVPTK